MKNFKLDLNTLRAFEGQADGGVISATCSLFTTKGNGAGVISATCSLFTTKGNGAGVVYPTCSLFSSRGNGVA
jgi:hypothetical protein